MDKLYQVKNLVGGRYVLIECLDVEKIVNFYRGNSFEQLQLDRSNEYLQMIRRI